jgi:alpha-mannosidase
MELAELIVLLPCHSLEDFPLYHDGADAATLLSGWVAPWHPALVAAARKMPRWFRADFPPDDVKGRLFLLPEVSRRLIATGWPARVTDEGALLVDALPDRAATAAECLARAQLPSTPLADALADDFFALGYCYLMVELLTRQMRYSTNVDEPHLEAQIVAAATAAMTGEEATAREHLTRCFEVLHEARERFYPVDSYLLDISLTAPHLLGEPLRRELQRSIAPSIHLTGELVDQLAESEPASLAALRDACAAAAASVVGGDLAEQEAPHQSMAQIDAGLRQGLERFQQHLGKTPRVYVRRRFGLTPALPLLLTRHGYIGAVHATFDDGVFPAVGQSKTRWQGLDGSAIDAFGRLPIDVRRVESFLGLPSRLSETMDLDHIATVAFIHWAGETNEWFEDLRRIHRYAPILGRFVTLDEYFEKTDSPGRMNKFEPDDYRAPYLQQAVARGDSDPISRCMLATRADATSRAERRLAALAALASGDAKVDATIPINQLAQALRLTDRAGEGGATLIANPFAQEGIAIVGDTHVAVPPLGFAVVAPAGQSMPSRKKPPAPMAAEHKLANEHVEVMLDPITGAVRSFRDFKRRANRISQQLALRTPGTASPAGDVWRGEEPASYSVMVADEWQITQPGPPVGEFVVRGRLVDREGATQANYQQTFRLARGQRWLEIDIHLDPVVMPAANPWSSYYACRFAWANEMADLYRSVHQTAQPTTLKRIEAPHFLEIRDDRARTAILTGGLPYHRRASERMLDTLLIAGNEARRDFRLAIGVELPSIAGASEQFLLGELPSLPVVANSAAPSHGWFFHIDGAHVLAVDWSPLAREDGARGFRAVLLETAGKAGRVKLRCFRPVARATQVDFDGGTIVMLHAAGDQVLVDFSSFELVVIEVEWSSHEQSQSENAR